MSRFSSASRTRREPSHGAQGDRALAQQVDLLKVQGARWRAEVAHWMAEAAEEKRAWREELEQLREELKQAAQQRRHANKECRSLQAQLSGLESRCTLDKEATQQDISALHDDLRFVKLRISMIHESRDAPISRLTDDVKRIEARCVNASDALEVLRDDLETLREDMVELTGDVRRLETLDTSPCMLAEVDVSQEDSDVELAAVRDRELAAVRAREDLVEPSLEEASDESNVELWRRELATARAEERTEPEEWQCALSALRGDLDRLRKDLEAETGTWKEEQLQFQDNVEDFVVRRTEGSCRQLSEDLESLREQLHTVVDEHEGERKALISRLYATAGGLDRAGVEEAVEASRVSAMCRLDADGCKDLQDKPTLAVAAAAAVEEELLGLRWEVRQLRLLQNTLPMDAVFDLSSVDLSQYERGDNWTSEFFSLGGVQGFKLRIYPYGEMRSPKGKASLFLCNRASFRSFQVSFRLEVNDLSMSRKMQNWEVGWWGSYDFFPAATEESPLRRVRVELLSYSRTEET